MWICARNNQIACLSFDNGTLWNWEYLAIRYEHGIWFSSLLIFENTVHFIFNSFRCSATHNSRQCVYCEFFVSIAKRCKNFICLCFLIKTKTFNLSRFFRLHSSLMRSQIYTQHKKNTARIVWAILTGQMKQCRHKFDLIDAFINRTQLSVFRLVFCVSKRKKNDFGKGKRAEIHTQTKWKTNI